MWNWKVKWDRKHKVMEFIMLICISATASPPIYMIGSISQGPASATFGLVISIWLSAWPIVANDRVENMLHQSGLGWAGQRIDVKAPETGAHAAMRLDIAESQAKTLQNPPPSDFAVAKMREVLTQYLSEVKTLPDILGCSWYCHWLWHIRNTHTSTPSG